MHSKARFFFIFRSNSFLRIISQEKLISGVNYKQHYTRPICVLIGYPGFNNVVMYIPNNIIKTVNIHYNNNMFRTYTIILYRYSASSARFPA